jgi:hypothetical protein
MGGKLWFLSLREEYRLRVFEKRSLRRIFCPRRVDVAGESCIMRNFVISTTSNKG